MYGTGSESNLGHFFFGRGGKHSLTFVVFVFFVTLQYSGKLDYTGNIHLLNNKQTKKKKQRKQLLAILVQNSRYIVWSFSCVQWWNKLFLLESASFLILVATIIECQSIDTLWLYFQAQSIKLDACMTALERKGKQCLIKMFYTQYWLGYCDTVNTGV